MAVILRASSPIWASEASREGLRKGELATISHKFSFVSPAPPPPPAFASPLACLSRVYFSRFFSNGELARRLDDSKMTIFSHPVVLRH